MHDVWIAGRERVAGQNILVFSVLDSIIARMIKRRIVRDVLDRLEHLPAVAVLGPRGVGKTTLAKEVGAVRESIYLDLENLRVREMFSDPEFYLSAHAEKLVILDGVQFVPGLFRELRGVIDGYRRRGRRAGHFLFLGSASRDLLGQSGESLAGRISYMELGTLDVLEVEPDEREGLWTRGGFPESFLAESEEASAAWRENFIQTYLERYIPQMGLRISSETLRRFLVMLAYEQGGLFNAARLARALEVDGKTVARYLDLMEDLMLVRRLRPYHAADIGKRLVKSPKIYVRDSGLVHALLGLSDAKAVLDHPVVADSWEGFVIENILRVSPKHTQASFYRTSGGAEIDLVLETPKQGLWAVEIKHGRSPKLGRGFYHACKDLNLDRRFVVYSGDERYPKAEGVEVIGLEDFCREL